MIADTGFVVSVATVTDKHHKVCLQIYNQQRIIYLPQSTLAEIGYLLRKAGGNAAVARLLWGLPESRYRVLPLQPEDLMRTAAILDKYHDSRLDFVDASIVAMAERLNITRILTLDQRDFRLVQLRHTQYLELLPPAT